MLNARLRLETSHIELNDKLLTIFFVTLNVQIDRLVNDNR